MGRHSAPDDPDDAELSAASVAVRERDAGVDSGTPGRHAGPVDNAETTPPATPTPEAPPAAAVINGTAPPRPRPVSRAPQTAEGAITQRIPLVVAEPAPVVPLAEPAPAVRPAPVTAPVPDNPPTHTVFRGAAHNSAADLHLVRSHRGVLAACAAAVVVPFVVEVVVLLVLGTLTGHSVLVWLWAPLVVAGVLLGVTLDIAHRRQTARRAAVDPSAPIVANGVSET